MGIEGLWKHVKSRGLTKEVLVEDFKGKRVAVDMYCILYSRWTISIGIQMGQSKDLEFDIDKVEAIWLRMLFECMNKFQRDGILPIIVIDGDKDPMKIEELERRGATRDKAKKSAQELRSADSLTEDQKSRLIDLIKESTPIPCGSKDKAVALFKAMGLPWVLSKGEAERTCALLNRDGIVDAAYTPDGDAVACGAKTIIKTTCDIYKGRIKHPGYIVVDTDSILDDIGMNIGMFQEMCIMMGTDFNPQFKKRCGWVRGSALLKKHGSIDKIGREDDISHLNHKEVLKRFEIVPWKDTVKEYDINTREPDVEFLTEHNLV